jgi:hypothetical protein
MGVFDLLIVTEGCLFFLGEQGEKKAKLIKRRFSPKNLLFYVILQNIKGHEIKNTI